MQKSTLIRGIQKVYDFKMIKTTERIYIVYFYFHDQNTVSINFAFQIQWSIVSIIPSRILYLSDLGSDGLTFAFICIPSILIFLSGYFTWLKFSRKMIKKFNLESVEIKDLVPNPRWLTWLLCVILYILLIFFNSLLLVWSEELFL